jgi:quercetin dioxygenase-like cupin family protein
MGIKVSACLALAAGLAVAGDKMVIENSATAKWTHDKGDPPGSDGVVLRMDSQTGGLELLARYPAGYVFPVHYHDSNERMILIEGRLSVKEGEAVRYIEPGGYAFLPAKQVQKLACVSQSRCVFYVAWDGKPSSHKAPAE